MRLLLAAALVFVFASIAAAQACGDGTPFGNCSTAKPFFCDYGVLVPNCAACGCNVSQACDGDSGECGAPNAAVVISFPAGGEVVAIPLAQKTIQVGNQDVFWVAIANILPDTQTFNVLVGFDEGYYPNGSKMEYPDSPDQSYINENWLLYDSGPYEIAPGDNKPVSIMTIVKPDISTTLSTVRGFYAFNVCVLKDGALSDNPNLDATNCWYDENNWQYLYPSEDEQDGIERGRPRRFIVEVR